MSTKKKSNTIRFLENISGGPLTFGNMIRSIRMCDEISQTKLAAMVNISRSYLCDIENGRRFVSIEKAAEFADVLGYSKNQFVATLIEEQLREAGLPLSVELKKAA